ncbi:MAG: hypothetical protein ACOC5T_09455 [Elusimicrobiota bacterium]
MEDEFEEYLIEGEPSLKVDKDNILNKYRRLKPKLKVQILKEFLSDDESINIIGDFFDTEMANYESEIERATLSEEEEDKAIEKFKAVKNKYAQVLCERLQQLSQRNKKD